MFIYFFSFADMKGMYGSGTDLQWLGWYGFLDKRYLLVVYVNEVLFTQIAVLFLLRFHREFERKYDK